METLLIIVVAVAITIYVAKHLKWAIEEWIREFRQ